MEEQHLLSTLITAARNRVSGALVIHGEAGVGKSALLDAAAHQATGSMQVIRADGFESEASMPYSALQRLGQPLTHLVDRLPEVQRTALLVASGRVSGPPPDPFLVGLGVLGVLSEAGHEMPVMCVIDDAHWLDSESLDALVFVARRLHAESVVILMALREGTPAQARITGLPSLGLLGLEVDAATQLLAVHTHSELDPMSARIVATATGGNPLALIDLAGEFSVRRLTEVSLSGEPIPIGRRLESHYLDRTSSLPDATQRWLLLAAAESTGDPDLLFAAARSLSLTPADASPAEAAGLVSIDEAVRFRHPLVRAAVYRSAVADERRAAHAALAAETDRRGLVSAAAWHFAEAVVGADDEAAQRLVDAADTAGERGGLTSRAALLGRAATLSTDHRIRSARYLAAAEAAMESGAAQVALDWIERVDPTLLDEVQRGRMLTVRAGIALFVVDPAGIRTASRDLLAAASAFHGVAPELEQQSLTRAFEYWMTVEWQAEGTSLRELGERLRAGADGRKDPLAITMRALSALILLPYGEAVPFMRQALRVFDAASDTDLPRFGHTCIVFTTALWDERGGAARLRRLARIARATGQLRVLDTLLWILSLFELDRGDPAAAGRYVEELRDLRRAMGYPAENVINAAYLAWLGAPEEQVAAIADGAAQAGFQGVHTAAMFALGTREIAQGHYRDALERLRVVLARPALQATFYVHSDVVEAAHRSGHAADAATSLAFLEASAAANDSEWLHGVLARCRAAVASDAEAEPLYATAIERLERADAPCDLGRAHLLYGEWLRRQRRRGEARDQLRRAATIFDRVQAPAFFERAQRELAAIGGIGATPHGRGATGALTTQEAAIARLAAQGLTNAEIGSELFISANTVDYHLRKVFQKLGVSSRRKLSEALERFA